MELPSLMSTHVPSFFDLITVIRSFLSSLQIHIAFSEKRSSPWFLSSLPYSYCLLWEKKFASPALRWRFATPIWPSSWLHSGHTAMRQLATSDAAVQHPVDAKPAVAHISELRTLVPDGEGHKDVQWMNEPLCRSIQLKENRYLCYIVLIYRCISSCKYKNK
jgi:hypothetical protein